MCNKSSQEASIMIKNWELFKSYKRLRFQFQKKIESYFRPFWKAPPLTLQISKLQMATEIFPRDNVLQLLKALPIGDQKSVMEAFIFGSTSKKGRAPKAEGAPKRA